MSELLVAVSPGELLDRLSILEIRCERVATEEARQGLQHKLDALRDLARSAHLEEFCAADFAHLQRVNRELWSLEDLIRSFARAREPDAGIADTALAICRLNDERATLKHRINLSRGYRETDDGKIYT